jgi:hypothetical protein
MHSRDQARAIGATQPINVVAVPRAQKDRRHEPPSRGLGALTIHVATRIDWNLRLTIALHFWRPELRLLLTTEKARRVPRERKLLAHGCTEYLLKDTESSPAVMRWRSAVAPVAEHSMKAICIIASRTS